MCACRACVDSALLFAIAHSYAKTAPIQTKVNTVTNWKLNALCTMDCTIFRGDSVSVESEIENNTHSQSISMWLVWFFLCFATQHHRIAVSYGIALHHTLMNISFAFVFDVYLLFVEIFVISEYSSSNDAAKEREGKRVDASQFWHISVAWHQSPGVCIRFSFHARLLHLQSTHFLSHSARHCIK